MCAATPPVIFVTRPPTTDAPLCPIIIITAVKGKPSVSGQGQAGSGRRNQAIRSDRRRSQGVISHPIRCTRRHVVQLLSLLSGCYPCYPPVILVIQLLSLLSDCYPLLSGCNPPVIQMLFFDIQIRAAFVI